MEDEVRLWLDFAETDLSVAKHLNDVYFPKPLEVICYHCQQAAEKALKALLIKTMDGEALPKTHNLSFLLQQMKKKVHIPEEYYDMADALTPYGIAARYPNELLIEDRHTETALKDAEGILRWVEEQL